jgi:hypothetical protein
MPALRSWDEDEESAMTLSTLSVKKTAELRRIVQLALADVKVFLSTGTSWHDSTIKTCRLNGHRAKVYERVYTNALSQHLKTQRQQ